MKFPILVHSSTLNPKYFSRIHILGNRISNGDEEFEVLKTKTDNSIDEGKDKNDDNKDNTNTDLSFHTMS